MPLPAALQARLLKRGIIRKQGLNHPEEEIIAEDYDDRQDAVVPQSNRDDKSERLMTGAPGCPNKWNIYHHCSEFCYSHWGDGVKEPTQDNERKRRKMLRKYPLLPGWDEVYDKGTGRYFYWNVLTDQVSWLPPNHPRSKVGPSAAKLRELLKVKESERSTDVEMTAANEDEGDGDSTELAHKEKRRAFERMKVRGKPVRKENDIDPMDPAAYSDIPRGTWSTGLERKGEAKTGADTTASGPLYQMRPYPSPGAVLRANAELRPKPSQT